MFLLWNIWNHIEHTYWNLGHLSKNGNSDSASSSQLFLIFTSEQLASSLQNTTPSTPPYLYQHPVSTWRQPWTPQQSVNHCNLMVLDTSTIEIWTPAFDNHVLQFYLLFNNAKLQHLNSVIHLQLLLGIWTNSNVQQDSPFSVFIILFWSSHLSQFQTILIFFYCRALSTFCVSISRTFS